MKHYFGLYLNKMTDPKIEMRRLVVVSDSVEDIIKFLEMERVPDYKDGAWSKSFRRGGPLEWYNPPLKHCIRKWPNLHPDFSIYAYPSLNLEEAGDEPISVSEFGD